MKQNSRDFFGSSVRDYYLLFPQGYFLIIGKLSLNFLFNYENNFLLCITWNNRNLKTKILITR